MNAHAHKLQQRHLDLLRLAADPAATAHEAYSARAAAARIAAQLRALGYPAAPRPRRAPPAPRAPAPGMPTIIVFDQRTVNHRTYHVAADYWCPACAMGRHHGGDCPVCNGPCEAVRV